MSKLKDRENFSGDLQNLPYSGSPSAHAPASASAFPPAAVPEPEAKTRFTHKALSALTRCNNVLRGLNPADVKWVVASLGHFWQDGKLAEES